MHFKEINISRIAHMRVLPAKYFLLGYIVDIYFIYYSHKVVSTLSVSSLLTLGQYGINRLFDE